MLQVPGEALVAEAQPPVVDTHIQESLSRRVGRGCAKLLGVAGIGLATGATSTFVSPTDVEIGPHNAEAVVTYDSAASFDFGFPGSIILPLENSGGFGVHVDLQEVPIQRDENSEVQNFTAEDLRNYASYYTNVEDDIADAKRNVLNHGLMYAAAGSLASIAAWRLIGKQRRSELIEPLTSRRGKATIATSLLVVSACISPPEPAAAVAEAEPVSSAFDGTPMEGAYVKGRYLEALVNDYGPEVIRYWEQNEEFYDRVSDNLRAAFETRAVLQPDEQYDIVFFYTDLHCNIGMGEIIGQTAEHYQASIMIDGGDTTISGTAAEQVCVRNIGSGPEGVGRVVASGNHDSDDTERQMDNKGYTVLNGETMEVEGYTILGDDSQDRSIIGQDTYQEGPETPEQIGQRLTEAACEDLVDIVVVHDPVSTVTQCANLILSGHTHRFAYDESTIPHLTGGSAGGAKGEGATIGPLQQPAVVYAIAFDKVTHKPEMYQETVFGTDASVGFGPIEHISPDLFTGMGE